MSIFVTGVASFVAGALLRQCRTDGIDVTGIDRVALDNPGCAAGDIRDASLADAIPEGTDAVVHLAALSRDQDCRGRSLETIDINVRGTLNVMQAARARGAKQFIFASTEWVYDRFEAGVAKREEHAIDPAALSSEYALSKLVAENCLRQQHAADGLPVTVLRFGIIYGPRDANWSAVEALVSSVANKDAVEIGARATARCFIHVDDIARAVLAARGRPGYEIFNIQGPKLVTLGDIIDTAARELSKTPKVVEKDPARPSVRLVSGDKAAQVLGWRPAIDLGAGIRSVIAHSGLR
jgi:nucleoside-diphosphate-sugar epimerase